MTGVLRRVARPLVIAAAVAASALLWNHLPANSDIYAPFAVSGAAGQSVPGRGIAATVTGVRIAATVRVDSVLTPAPASAAGRWVVVDADVEPRGSAALLHADLVVGGDTYRPTDRFAAGTLLGGVIQPGITLRGSWAFDVATAVLDADPPMVLRVWVDDGRLDSRLEIALDAVAAEDIRTADLSRPRQVVP